MIRALASRVFVALLPLGAGPAAPAVAASGEIAGGGFGRPRLVDTISAGSDVRVAVAGGEEGPIVLWEDGGGLSALPTGAEEPERIVRGRGLRDLEAGAADGDPVIVWAERDLATGRTRFDWRWRDETRTLFTTGQTPRVRLVAGSERPELVVARPIASGWRLDLHDWDGEVRTMEPRPLTVAGLDALRDGDGVRIAWLEGSDEVILGQVERIWTAYLATWPDGEGGPGEPTELGPASRVNTNDAVRLALVDGDLRTLWPGPEGTLRATGARGAATDLGPGVPLGWLGGAWTWVNGAELRRATAGAEGVETVLRLPAAPERVAAAEVGGVIQIAWSSGRYRGGIEVWTVDDVVPYRAGPVERVAAAMGWDPWRPWTAAGGHLLLSLLTAVLGAAVLTPAWWAGAALLARRRAVRPGVAALEGGVIAVASVLVALALVALRATFDPAQVRALVGSPALVASASAVGLVLAWAIGRRQDAEATFGRLTGAWIAGGAMLFVLAFGTLQAWQVLFGAAA